MGKQEGKALQFNELSNGCGISTSNCNKDSSDNLKDEAVYGTQSSAIGYVGNGDVDDISYNTIGIKISNSAPDY